MVKTHGFPVKIFPQSNPVINDWIERLKSLRCWKTQDSAQESQPKICEVSHGFLPREKGGRFPLGIETGSMDDI